MSPIRISAVVSLVSLVALAACGGRAPAEHDVGVVASYEEGTVSQTEFDRVVERRQRQGIDLTLEGEDWRLAVAREIALCETLTAGLGDSLEKARRDVTDRALDPAMRAELGWQDLNVTGEEVRAEYDGHPDRYVDAEKLRLQMIFLAAEGDEAVRAAARERAEEIRRQIVGGADFAEMAQRHSDSANADGGGWMVLKKDASVFPEFADTAWALDPGEAGDVIETPRGFHVVRLGRRVPSLTRPFEDVQEFARQRALDSKLAAAEAALLMEAEEEGRLVRYHERLGDPALADDAVLFSLGDRVFTAQDLVSSLSQGDLAAFYARYFEDVRAFLDAAAVHWVLIDRAREAGLAQRPDVAAEIDAAASEAVCRDEWTKRLHARATAVPEAELREFYEQYRERYKTLRRRSVSVLLLTPGDRETLWDVQRRAERLAEEGRQGADFSQLAERHSQHITAVDGGRIESMTDEGLFVMIPTRARGRRILDELAVGEVSRPFLAEVYDPAALRFHRTGVFVVRLDAEEAPRQAPFEEVAEQVRDNFLRRNFQRFDGEETEALAAEIGFRFDPSALADA